MEINAKNYGIVPNTDITVALGKLMQEFSTNDEPKTLIIDAGEYYIDSAKCNKEILYITNSCADNEFDSNETARLCNIALNISNIRNLTIIAEDVTFAIDGRVTNIVINNSHNITIKGLALDVINPHMHELKVIKRRLFHIDYELNKESNYIYENGNYYFVGKDFKREFNVNAMISWWIGHIPADNINSLWRTQHPLAGAIKIKEIAPYKFRATYLIPKNFNVNSRFYIFDHKRKNAGIFLNNSSNITIDGIKQYFNYGLCYVAQDCEDLMIRGCKFAPKENSTRLMASVADFIQLCMCKGNIVVDNNTFIGAGDDTLNVHGIHYCVSDINQQTIDVKYCHAQTLGFNPLHIGDCVEFINRTTLAIHGKANILASELIDNYTIRLTLDNVDGLKIDMVLEDITRCPNLEFVNNYMTRIITRGLLVTTRGKVVIDNNNFDNTSMHSILLSNDAKNWYESGRVEDITITNNTFGRCPMHTLQVMPENGENNIIIHKNITFKDNIINSKNPSLYFKNAENITLDNNKFAKVAKPRIININSKIN